MSACSAMRVTAHAKTECSKEQNSMKIRRLSLVSIPALAFAIAVLALPTQGAATGANKKSSPDLHLISENAMLAGLPGGAVFPFIDTTPSTIRRAHIAVTDSTSNCAAGAAPPDNVQILVGEAGVELVGVMGATTNTGISTTPGQCVFHVTVKAGHGGVPAKVTDIVVLNAGSAALTAVNTITASADVVRRKGDGAHTH